MYRMERMIIIQPRDHPVWTSARVSFWVVCKIKPFCPLSFKGDGLLKIDQYNNTVKFAF